MKKKCTNGKCRKKFTVCSRNSVKCPYCGKEYPRLKTIIYKAENHDCGLIQEKPYIMSYTVLFCDCKKKAIGAKLIREMKGFSLVEAVDTVKNLPDNPVILKDKLNYSEAIELKNYIDKTLGQDNSCKVIY